jgi:predicted amidophosphoribosyltransferase
MPTFKHPCPRCAKFINRDVAVCPFCGTRDPFAPARCPNCRTEITDLAWVACPRCGQELGTNLDQFAPNQPPTPSSSPTRTDQPGPTPQPGPAPIPPAAAAAKCTGCGAPLPAGARFCTVCGTLAG